MDKKILAEIELVANDMAKLQKSQAQEREELKSFLKFIFGSKTSDLKKAVTTLSLEQKLLLKSILEKANAANWQGVANSQPPDAQKMQDWLTKPVKSQIDEDMDAPDERLIDMHVDAVKHQGDNEPKGFDGQVVHDVEIDKNGQHKNPGQMKGKQPRVTGGAYEPEHVLNRENLVKPSMEEQLKDEEEQKEGRHRTLLSIKNEDIEINKKVRKEWEKKKALSKGAKGPDGMQDERSRGASPSASVAGLGGGEGMGKSNPDAQEDQKLAEQVEELVSNHMKENEAAERKEGHSIYKAAPVTAPKPASAPMNLFNPSSLPKISAQPIPQVAAVAGKQAFGKAHPPEGVNPKKYEDCVMDVKAKQGESKVNPWAVCGASLKKYHNPETCEKCMAKSEELQSHGTKLKNQHENEEDHKDSLSKADIEELSKKPPQEQMSKEDQQKEINKYEWFEDQKSPWKSELDRESAKLKKEQEKMKDDYAKRSGLEKSEMVDPQMPKELDSEQAMAERNKMTPWSEQEGHEAVLKEYNDLKDMYQDFKKAKEALVKKYIGFEKLTHELGDKGAKDPKALAAWIGRKKYGKEDFQHKASEAKKSLDRPENSSVVNEGDEKRNTSMRASMSAQDHQKGHDLVKMDEDFVGKDKSEHFDSERGAIVMKSNSMEEKKMHNLDPNERREEWGKHWGYDWNIKEIGRTPSGKRFYLSVHPDEEGFTAKDHEDAANMLKRMREEAPSKQLSVSDGGMEMDKQLEESINRHLKLMRMKADMDRKNLSKLQHDLNEPKQDRENQDNLIKGRPVVWGESDRNQLNAYKHGRNAHYDVDKTIVAAAIVGQQIAKTRWTDGGHTPETLKKSEKLSINDMIAQNLDKSSNDLKKAQELLTARPSGAFNVKSFEDQDLIKSMNLTKEEEARLLELLNKK